MMIARNISVDYGSTRVLSEVSFELGKGMIVALLGPNGAGKSTLLRSLNGVVPISEGKLELDGQPLKQYSRREIARKIAVVAQENETKFPVTVLEFVLSGRFAYGGSFGWETVHDHQAASSALEQCDLLRFEGKLMAELSGGERQRAVLARALAAETPILLLDEPTANLDLGHQELMFRLVQSRCRNSGGSAMIITHDLNLASAFADEVMLLRDGRIEALGRPADVLTRDNISAVFGVEVLLDEHPLSGKPRVTNVF